ncbi:hypothetical protein LTR64_005547 [Lithohypha guttulata]|uniref:uncharacterized protein n=1 Tax=Lithohypha guttulata TaxID=1690604 RepID=UPI002DE0BD8B|nr:hypothetical protein LTR51_002660 [Lithohypha guttulata]
MLPARVFIPHPPNPTQEDIFSSSLSALFTDDTQNSHGIPGQSVIYNSPRHGEIKLGIPQHPDVEEGRKLFAHYLWNAGVVAADAIETASNDRRIDDSEDGKVSYNKEYWDMRGKDVLELGAGTALPSIISALSSARSVTISDHSSSPAIINDTIARNVKENLHIKLVSSQTTDDTTNETSTPPQPPRTNTTISIHGLTWGDELFTSSTQYGKPADPQPPKHSFDKIIIADCLWMPSQHANLVKTINSYLREKDEDEDHEGQACALVIAGFHTGRSIVARFFEIATGSRLGSGETAGEQEIRCNDEEEEKEDEDVRQVKGILIAAEIFEIDVDCNVRPWLAERPGESKDHAKRWCVCAALVRR